jgi:hypothetical protein
MAFFCLSHDIFCKIFLWPMPLFLSTHKQCILGRSFYVQQHCYVSLKTLYPGGIETRVFLSLRRMRHAARASTICEVRTHHLRWQSKRRRPRRLKTFFWDILCTYLPRYTLLREDFWLTRGLQFWEFSVGSTWCPSFLLPAPEVTLNIGETESTVVTHPQKGDLSSKLTVVLWV